MKIVLFHFITGLNGVYPNPSNEVESHLATFGWRFANSTASLPAYRPIIGLIDLDKEENPEEAFALAIAERFPRPEDEAESREVARKLLEKIERALAAANAPLVPWEKELLNGAASRTIK